MTTKPLSKEEQLKRLREFVLGTGVPLENEVDQALKALCKERDGILRRDECFGATTPDGGRTLRSIDFRCDLAIRSKNIPDIDAGPSEQATLVFLIDAKYSKDDQPWWFIPSHSKHPICFPNLTPATTSNSLVAEVKVYRRELPLLAILQGGCSRAKKGIKQKDPEDERSSITRGQEQLIQSVCHLLEDRIYRIGATSETDNNYHRDFTVIMPMVVTNADLFMLKDSITRHHVACASDEGALGAKFDVIAVEQPDLYYLQEELRKYERELSCRQRNSLEWVSPQLTTFPVLFINIRRLRSFLSEQCQRFVSAIEQIGK